MGTLGNWREKVTFTLANPSFFPWLFPCSPCTRSTAQVWARFILNYKWGATAITVVQRRHVESRLTFTMRTVATVTALTRRFTRHYVLPNSSVSLFRPLRKYADKTIAPDSAQLKGSSERNQKWKKKWKKKKKRNWLYPVEFTSTVTSSISCCSWLANWRTGGALGAAFFEAFGPVAAPPLPAVWGAFPFVPGAVSTPIVCDVSSVIGSLFHFNSLHLFTTTTTRTDVSEFQEQVIRRRDWVLLRTEDCCLFAYFLRFIWVILFRFFLFLSEIFFLFQVKWRCLLWSDSHSWRWKTLNCLMHQCTTPTRARQRADVGTDVVVSAIVSLGYAIHTFGVGVSIWYRRRLSSSSIFFFFFSVVALVGRSRAKTRVRSLCWPAGPLGIFALISRLSDGWNRAQLG